MAPRTRTRGRNRPGNGTSGNGNGTRDDLGPGREPIPPGWPGDDPTLPDELGALGGRPARTPRRRPPARHDREVPGVPDRDREHDLDEPVHGTRDPHRRERGGLAFEHTHHTPDPGRRARDERGERAPDAHDRGTDRHDLRQHDPEPDPHDDGLDDDDLDLIAGVQPAGRVLVVMVAALVLAMLVNADALVARAERKPPGRERDRALAIWHPVQDVSHVLQLYRVRQVADWVAGDEDEPAATPRTDRESRRAPGTTPADEPDGAAGDDTATDDGTDDGTAEDGAFALRTPTEDEPLRLLVTGDFTAQVLGVSLEQASAATGVVDATVHYESASGLTRQDYFDWPAALESDVDEHDPEVVVVVLGVNDAQGIVLDDGTPAQLDDPRWAEEYSRRVGSLMDQLRADDRMVVWVAQPPMRAEDFGARMAALNQIYAAEAADRPWVSFVDLAALVGGPGGSYAETGTDAAGAPVELRQPDGIHLTPAAGDLIAAHVLGLVGDHVDLGEASAGEPGEPADG
jgi:hypothetical protein